MSGRALTDSGGAGRRVLIFFFYYYYYLLDDCFCPCACVCRNDESERAKLQAWAVQYADDVQRILAKIPRELLLLLKTNDCLRAVDTQLGTPVNSFVIMAGFCTRAINQDRIEVGHRKHTTSHRPRACMIESMRARA